MNVVFSKLFDHRTERGRMLRERRLMPVLFAMTHIAGLGGTLGQR